MRKKLSALLLAGVMLLGSVSTVFAAPNRDLKTAQDLTRTEKIEALVDAGVIEGRLTNDGSKDLALIQPITRAEIAKILVNAAKGNRAQYPNVYFEDVSTNHWAHRYIYEGVALQNRYGVSMINGYPDFTFKPENSITYAELSKMLVALVKQDLTVPMAETARWTDSWMLWSAELNLNVGISYLPDNYTISRGEAFEMIWNALYLYNLADVDVNKTIVREGLVVDVRKDYFILDTVDGAYKVHYDIRDYRDLRVNDPLGWVVRVEVDKNDNLKKLRVLGADDIGTINITNPLRFPELELTLKTGRVLKFDIKNDTQFYIADTTTGVYKASSLRELSFKQYFASKGWVLYDAKGNLKTVVVNERVTPTEEVKPPVEPTEVRVIFDYTDGYSPDGDRTISMVVKKGMAIIPPADGVKTGKVFLGWGLDETAGKDQPLFSFVNPINESTSFFAVWDVAKVD